MDGGHIEMAESLSGGTSTRASSTHGAGGAWNWHPTIPIVGSPIASWPLRPLIFFKNLARGWLPISDKLIVVGLSVLTWFCFSPALERCREFEVDWIAQIYIRNLGLLALVAGGLHLYLHTFGCQGARLRYDSRAFHRDNKRYTLSNQVFDNMFWSLGSGVTCWTAYEVVGM